MSVSDKKFGIGEIRPCPQTVTDQGHVKIVGSERGDQNKFIRHLGNGWIYKVQECDAEGKVKVFPQTFDVAEEELLKWSNK